MKTNKFKLISEHADHFMVHDGSGELKIAKKHLDEASSNKIKKLAFHTVEVKKMAEGGEVSANPMLKEDYEKKAMAQARETDKLNEKRQIQGQDLEPYPVSVQSMMDRTAVNRHSQHFADGETVLPEVPMSMQSPNVMAQPQPADAPFTMGAMNPAINPVAGLPDTAESGLIPQQPAAMPSSPDVAPAEAAAAPQPQPEAMPKSPAPPAAPGTTAPAIDTAFGGIQKGLQTEAQGISQVAQAKAQAAADAVESYNKQIEGMKLINGEYTQKLERVNQDSEKLRQELASQKIDPDHYMNSVSAFGSNTWGRIGTAFAIALGGLGGGLQKNGQNLALDTINKAIERDVDAQAKNLANKQSLLSKNLEQTRDIQQAKALTYSQMATMAAAKIARDAAGSAGAEAQGIAKQLEGGLMQKAGEVNKQWAQLNMVAGLQNGQSDPNQLGAKITALEAIGHPMGKEFRARLVPGAGPNGEDVLAKRSPSAEETKLLNEKINALENTKKLREFSAKYSGLLPTTPENVALINEGKALAFLTLNQYRVATGQGVYKESQAEADRKLVDDNPTQFFSKFRADPKYKVLETSIQQELDRQRSSLGIPTRAANAVAPGKGFSFTPAK